MTDFEQAIVNELKKIECDLQQRRDELARSPLTQENMGRLYAIGSADTLVWRLLRRAQGVDSV